MNVSEVRDLVGQMHSIMSRLLEIQEEANHSWRERQEHLDNVMHEMEIIPLNAVQRTKAAGYIIDSRIARRQEKQTWYAVKAFNEAFTTQRQLNSLVSSIQTLDRQIRRGEVIVEDRGILRDILGMNQQPTTQLQLEVAATIEPEEVEVQ